MKQDKANSIRRAAAAQVLVCTSLFRETTPLPLTGEGDTLAANCQFPQRFQHRFARHLRVCFRLLSLPIMAHDEEFFEPKPGRSRRDPTGRTDKAPVKLMQRVARSGGNPRRLGSVIPPAKCAPSGRYNTRSRGAKISATIPRESGWSVDRASGSRFRMRRVTVKARYVKAAGKGAGRDHLAYVERDGVTREGEPGRLYSTFSDEVDRDAFLDRGIDDRHQFRFIVAPEDGARYADLKPLTRDLMARVEADLGTTLDWVAVDHHDTGHPHVHVIVRGVT